MNAHHGTSQPPRRRRMLAVAGTTVAAVVPWIVAQASGEELRVISGGMRMVVNLPMVVSAALAVSLAGWGLLAGLERRTSRARRIWTTVAVAVLLISLVPLPIVEATTASRVYLALMHVAVGVVLIPALRASATLAPAPAAHPGTAA